MGDMVVAEKTGAGTRKPKGSLLPRQFAVEATRRQRIFDGVLGIAPPVLTVVLAQTNLLWFSPFADWSLRYPNPVVSVCLLVSLVCLAYVLTSRERNPKFHLWAASVLFAGGFLNLGLVLLLLPTGWMGVGAFVFNIPDAPAFAGIAFLIWFLPWLLHWFASFVYARNGVRSIRSAGLHYGPILPMMVTVLVLGALLFLAMSTLEPMPPTDRLIEMWWEILPM